MKKKNFIALSVLALIVGGYFILNYFAHQKMASLLDEQVDSGNLKYENFSISLLRGNIALNRVYYHYGGLEINADRLQIKGFSYWRYLLKNQIYLRQIIVDTPLTEITKSSDTSVYKSVEVNGQAVDFDMDISVKRLSVHRGSLNLKRDSLTTLSIKKYDLQLSDITANKQSFQRILPFDYGEVSLEVSELWHDLNSLQQVAVAHLYLSDKTLQAHHISLLPKYTTKDYIRVIPYEKDLMELKLDTLSIPQYQLKFSSDTPHFSAAKILLRDIDFDLFRDKTVEDDTRVKKLYSEMLRNMKLKLDIDTLHINRGRIKYRERIHKERTPGEILFTDLEASVTKLTNTNLKNKNFPETKVDISTRFMGQSPLSVQWAFRVNDTLDTFTIKGRGTNITSESINSFFLPAFNMKAQGVVDHLYFNFGGDANTASGDFQIKYENFAVEVLRKNGKEKKKILSWMANIIVKESSGSQDISKHVKKVNRDHSKSFWNYFWSCIEAGLGKTMI
ncbi:hypothetical protein [Sinomicrobium sp.]